MGRKGCSSFLTRRSDIETVLEVAPTGGLVITRNFCFAAKDRLVMQIAASLKLAGLWVEVVANESLDSSPALSSFGEERGETVAASFANQAAGLVAPVDE